MAATAMQVAIYAPTRQTWGGSTPEIYFSKQIDNSRVMRLNDPERGREVRMLSAALGVFFLLIMVYAWQHFSAIEYGYRIEALKAQREVLVESNRALRLEQASLRDPERIDTLARQMGLQSPQAGQLQSLEPTAAEPAASFMARAIPTQTIAGAP